MLSNVLDGRTHKSISELLFRTTTGTIVNRPINFEVKMLSQVKPCPITEMFFSTFFRRSFEALAGPEGKSTIHILTFLLLRRTFELLTCRADHR